MPPYYFYFLRIKLLSANHQNFERSGSGVEIKTSFAALMALVEYLGGKLFGFRYIAHTHVSFKNGKSEQLSLQTKIIEIPLPIHKTESL